MILAIASKWRSVIIASRPMPQRTSSDRSSTIAKPENSAPTHEVRRENALLPAGHQACREIQADDGMHRDDQRDCDGRQGPVEDPVRLPLPGGATPAQGERAIERGAPSATCLVAHRGEVGQRADVRGTGSRTTGS